MKVCETCGKSFEPGHVSQRFCSDRCRFRHHGRRKAAGAKLDEAVQMVLIDPPTRMIDCPKCGCRIGVEC